MMTYIEKSKRQNKARWFYLAVFILPILFVSTNYLYPSFYAKIFVYVAKPFWRLDYAYQNGAFDGNDKLLAENLSLRKELEELKIKQGTLSFIESENKQLKAGFGIASSSKFIVASVLEKPSFIPYDIFIVDAGKVEGVSTSSIIYAPGELPIGKVVEVYDNTSKAVLFSSPTEKTEISIGDNNIPGMATGRGGGQYFVELPRGLNIKIGDLITYSNLNKFLGKVEYIDEDPSLTFERIYFAVPTNIYQIKWVKVSLNSK